MNRKKSNPLSIRRKHLRFSFLLVSALFGFSFYSGEADRNDSFVTRIAEHFRLRKALNEEALYLQLDKPYYAAAEEIFFKGYLLDATTLLNDRIDNFIYVDLVDRYDSLITRRKFKRDSNGSGFSGNLRIPTEIQAGKYAIRAYSNWMRNFPNSFFVKNIEIGNPIERDVQAQIRFTPVDGSKIISHIRFTNRQGEPYRDIPVVCALSDRDGEKRKEKIITTDKNGMIEFSFDRNDKFIREKKQAVTVRFKHDVFRFDHTYAIPALTDDFDVAFLPEGGNLLAGVRQRVAFKALHENGFAENVTGVVLDPQNDTLARFVSEHNGMGVFVLQPQAGQQLRAEVRSEKGVTKQFLLPTVKNEGIVLSLNRMNNKISFRILQASDTQRSDSLFIAAYHGNRLETLAVVPPGRNEGSFDTTDFLPGVSKFVLCDASGTPLSSRLVFIRAEQEPVVTVECDNPRPGKREKVNVEVDIESESPQGYYSVSVTDAEVVTPDSLADHIRSRLYLTADLNGHIENPGYYFENNDRERDHHLDLVMLTHGWARFDFPTLTDTVPPRCDFPAEPVQFISGKVRTLLNATAKQAMISLLGTRDTISIKTFSDESGTFLFGPLDHQDSTIFILRASNAKGKDRVEILPDDETIPRTENSIPFTPEKISVIPENYLQRSFEQFIDSGGIPTINLQEITITETRFKEQLLTKNEEIVPKYSITIRPETIYKPGRQSLLDALLKIKGMTIHKQDSYLTSRRLWYKGHLTKFFVNDIPIDIDMDEALDKIPFEDVKEIHIHRAMLKVIEIYNLPYKERELAEWLGIPSGRTEVALNPERWYHNIVSITLKSKYSYDKRFRPWYARFNSLGYTRPKESYHPKYDTPESHTVERDNRSTIYWNPNLETDSSGKARFSFYTSDQSRHYRIVIEGVTPNGEIVYYNRDLWKNK